LPGGFEKIELIFEVVDHQLIVRGDVKSLLVHQLTSQIIGIERRMKLRAKSQEL
jgi:hypothetical protein